MLVVAGCLALLVPLALGLPTTETKHTYDGHKLLEIFHNTPDDFQNLMKSELKYGLDIWKMPKHQNDSMVVNVPPHQLSAFLDELNAMGARISVMVENLREMIEEVEAENTEHRRKRSVSSKSTNIDLETYHTYDEIIAYLNAVVAAPNSIATLQTIGQSAEMRDIKVLKISTGGTNKKKIFIDGGIHAREWIAPAAVLYFIDQLTTSLDPPINALLTNYDIYLIPVLNPDGYQYSHTNQRLWRKNRKINSGSSCVGVDLNRNFPFQWNPAVGGSTNPCSDIYSGLSAGSELETKALVNFLENNANDMVAYLTIHSYGQMWLYPWGYTSALPSDSADLEIAAWIGANDIYQLYGTLYTIGSATNTLYSAAGGSDDYAKGGAGIKYSYTLELRDTGRYGFVLPASQIRETCEETFQGFVAFADHINSMASINVG